MAKVKITGHASGSGVFTITAPNSNTDRTITLPDATGTLATTAEAFNPDGAVVFNESGADVDFRVESDTKVNAFTVNGATGRVGVNRGTDPDARLDIVAANETALAVTATVSGEYGVIVTSGSTNATPIMDLRDTNNTSRLKVLADGRGLSPFTAKAWAYWDGTGTLDIRAAHNISSVSDYGTGWYAPTYTNAMAGTSYGVYACGSFNNANRSRSVSGRVQNAGSAEVFSQADNSAIDNADCYVLIFSEST